MVAIKTCRGNKYYSIALFLSSLTCKYQGESSERGDYHALIQAPQCGVTYWNVF